MNSFDIDTRLSRAQQTKRQTTYRKISSHPTTSDLDDLPTPPDSSRETRVHRLNPRLPDASVPFETFTLAGELDVQEVGREHRKRMTRLALSNGPNDQCNPSREYPWGIYDD